MKDKRNKEKIKDERSNFDKSNQDKRKETPMYVKILKKDYEDLSNGVRSFFYAIDAVDIKRVKDSKNEKFTLCVWDPEEKKFLDQKIENKLKVTEINIDGKSKTFFELVGDKEYEYLSGWKRAKADITNLQSRFEKEKSSLVEFAKIQLVEELLLLKDNFDQALISIPREFKDNPWIQGVNYIDTQLDKILSENNIEEIPVKGGDLFNPDLHEAIEAKTSDGKDEEEKSETENIVTKIFKKGYRMKGKVIRPAMVSLDDKHKGK